MDFSTEDTIVTTSTPTATTNAVNNTSSYAYTGNDN